VVQRVLSFLDLASGWVPGNIEKRYRVAANRRLISFDIWRAQEVMSSRGWVRTVWQSMPLGLRRRIESSFDEFAKSIDLYNRRSAAPAEQPLRGTLARLQEHFQADERRLAEVCGIGVPW
jgi:hypothetical protein